MGNRSSNRFCGEFISQAKIFSQKRLRLFNKGATKHVTLALSWFRVCDSDNYSACNNINTDRSLSVQPADLQDFPKLQIE